MLHRSTICGSNGMGSLSGGRLMLNWPAYDGKCFIR